MFFKIILLTSVAFSNTKSLTYESPKLNLEKQDSQEVAEQYLAENAADLGVEKGLENLKLSSKKESLLGTHFYYTQVFRGVEVDGSGVSVSISKKDSSILKAYSTLNTKSKFESANKKIISKDKAIDEAWVFIKAHGNLYGIPSAKKIYFLNKSNYVLGYKVSISISKPLGVWEIYVSSTGSVLDYKNILTPTKNSLDRNSFQAFSGAIIKRSKAESEFYDGKELPQKFLERTNGSGYSFLPDPRTTLKKDSLRDASAADLFELAYIRVDLLEISHKEDGYYLEGPYVKLDDFDHPNNAPVKSEDGQWNYKRGENGFNDSMTYYILDHSQRYMQSLGFVGEKGIQLGPITVDTDGVNGGDNSYFIPSENALSFGHGCVDDNEDSDVILHEYGHAIQYSINENWSSGDTRAMGEGFGDYWAASYSIRTRNGRDYQTNRVFTWDGLFECWDGRKLDAMAAKYDHEKTYYDHQYIPGGFISDELWSTPLFQSLLEALNAGLSHEEVDTIILEAHFGMGSGIKMRDMAESIVKTAEALYPNTSYASIFRSNFERHKILEPPKFSFAKDSFKRLIGKIKSLFSDKEKVGKK